MADLAKRLYNGTLSTVAGTTLYTVPVATKAIITEIVLCNKTATPYNVSLTYAGTSILNNKSVNANDTLIIKTNSLLEATTILAGSCSNATSVDIYVSGVEVS